MTTFIAFTFLAVGIVAPSGFSSSWRSGRPSRTEP